MSKGQPWWNFKSMFEWHTQGDEARYEIATFIPDGVNRGVVGALS